MKAIIKEMPKRLVITIAVLLVLIAIALAAVDTLGRYTTSFDGEVGFSAKGKETAYVYVVADEPPVAANGEGRVHIWMKEDVAGTQTALVAVTNSPDASTLPESDLYVKVRVFIPNSSIGEGNDPPTLKIGGNNAEAVAVASGSEMHSSYGEGYVYRLLDGTEEKCFELKLKETENLMVIELVLEDMNINTENIRIIVETVHSSGGEEK